MNHVREIAKKIVAEMEHMNPLTIPADDRVIAADTYRRIAIRDYAEAFKHANDRMYEHNLRCIEQAYIYAEKAISLGASEQRLDVVFAGLRSYWSKKLAGVEK
jgi:hypothetical protein